MTATDTTPATSVDASRLVRHLDKSTGVPQEVSEADAIGMLLDRLPHADAAELLQLAGSCPAPHIARYAVQAADLLEGLRAELTAVVAAAHDEALAAQEWLASLENDDALAELGAA